MRHQPRPKGIPMIVHDCANPPYPIMVEYRPITTGRERTENEQPARVTLRRFDRNKYPFSGICASCGDSVVIRFASNFADFIDDGFKFIWNPEWGDDQITNVVFWSMLGRACQSGDGRPFVLSPGVRFVGEREQRFTSLTIRQVPSPTGPRALKVNSVVRAQFVSACRQALSSGILSHLDLPEWSDDADDLAFADWRAEIWKKLPNLGGQDGRIHFLAKKVIGDE